VGDGRPPAEPEAGRPLRDRAAVRVLLLALVLLASFLVARTCGSYDKNVSQDEAIAIATRNAGFVPCAEPGCVVIRAVPRGIPSRLFWLVGLAEDLDDSGEPTRFRNLLIDVQTGAVSPP
jgi:hypothetical protein